MARASPVNDQEMGGLDPLGLGQESAELIVDLLGVARPGESETLGDTRHVRIDGKGGNAKGIAEDDIGGLPSHARQLHELGEGPRDLSPVTPP